MAAVEMGEGMTADEMGACVFLREGRETAGIDGSSSENVDVGTLKLSLSLCFVFAFTVL